MKFLWALVAAASAAAACGGDTSHWDSTPTPAVLDATQAPASATSAPGCTPHTYTVQAGDTMLGIAVKFDVELSDVIALNADTINDPNTLAIGQVVNVPCPKPPTPSGTAVVTPSTTPAAVP